MAFGHPTIPEFRAGIESGDFGVAPGSALRMFLDPSFHAKAGITLVETTDGAFVTADVWEAVAGLPGIVSSVHADACLPRSVFADAIAGFSAAFDAEQSEPTKLCVDGMPISCRLSGPNGSQLLACQPYRPTVSAFVAALIENAWKAFHNAAIVRNALADCARYVGLDLPRTAGSSLCRIAVLGTPDERASLTRQLNEALGKR